MAIFQRRPTRNSALNPRLTRYYEDLIEMPGMTNAEMERIMRELLAYSDGGRRVGRRVRGNSYELVHRKQHSP